MATEKISTSIIADDAVTTAKVADDAITGALIENNPTIAGNLSVSGTAAVTGTSTFTGASTFSGGIANSGTITAGTIGSGVTQPKGHLNYISQKTYSGVQTFTIISGTDGFNFDNTYQEYVFHFTSFSTSGTGVSPYIRVGSSGGIRTSGYGHNNLRFIANNGGTTNMGNNNGTNYLNQSWFDINGVGNGGKCILIIRDMADANKFTTSLLYSEAVDSTYSGINWSSGKVLTKEAHDRFSFMTLTDQGLSLVATQYGVNYG